jgi:type IV secretory pathway TrbF-like protein
MQHSREWVLRSVNKGRSQKESLINSKEPDDPVAAYKHARKVWRERLGE